MTLHLRPLPREEPALVGGAMKFSLNKEPMVQRRSIPENHVTYDLPHMPPSTNHLYFNVPGKGRVKTSAYDDWLHQAGILIRRQGIARMTQRVDIVISLEDKHPRRDASNTIKPIEDLLVKLGVLPDDRSKFVRSVMAKWAPIDGIRIDIRPFSFSETRSAA